MQRRGNPDSVAIAQQGFTLVELIVVIVILGILAAIAIPALTGYIAKSEDKQYEMRARDINIAAHAVVDEGYAKGELTLDNTAASATTKGSNAKFFLVGSLSQVATRDPADGASEGDIYAYYRIASELLGEEYTNWPGKGGWHLYFAGSSNATAFTADGFFWEYSPEGSGTGKPYIVVTYKVPRFQPAENTYAAFWAQLNATDTPSYDPEAGYEVYHLVFPDS